MTKQLYLADSYLKEFDARVMKVVSGKYVVLDESAFYPQGGGQPSDTGKLVKEGEEYRVLFAKKIGSDISLEVDREGLKEGDQVRGALDWENRHELMRMHTAAHLLSAVIYKETGALITGNQLGSEQSRIDFDLEEFDKEKMNEYVEKANQVIGEDLKVEVSYVERGKALEDKQLARLAKGLPENIQAIRIVSIGDYDRQADGGTHVRSLKEIGKIIGLKAENKGKSNRRIYFKLEKS